MYIYIIYVCTQLVYSICSACLGWWFQFFGRDDTECGIADMSGTGSHGSLREKLYHIYIISISYLYHIYIISISYLYHLTSFPSISFESPFFAMENGKMSFESQVWCWIWTLSPVSIWIDAVWRRHFASPVESSARCVTQTWWLCAGELCKGLYGLHARLVRWFITCY